MLVGGRSRQIFLIPPGELHLGLLLIAEKWYGILHYEPYHLQKWYDYCRVCRIGSTTSAQTLITSLQPPPLKKAPITACRNKSNSAMTLSAYAAECRAATSVDGGVHTMLSRKPATCWGCGRMMGLRGCL